MQEAFVVRQILQQQAGNRRNLPITSDAIPSNVWYAPLGYEFHAEGAPLGDVAYVVPDIFDLGEYSWEILLGKHACDSLLPSRVRSGITEVGEGSRSAVASDQLEDEAGAELRKEQGEIYARIEDAKNELLTKTYNRLRQRFAVLFEFDDDEPVRVSPGSVRQLLQILRTDNRLRCPGIFVTDRRNIKAIWQASESQIFWIEFEPNGDVTYLAFFPNKKRSDGVERISALSTIEDALDRARETGALAWMRS